ncbi:hypothetical protein [Emticicia agri]|uniref:Glycosyltransferase RgtA/B/C/D-like domain-containing protein n=1 Tax=Emticicia agri TaxID=2492393 RepID=A0A4Q5LT65_9BACT|nr:hypothetical protein [Emticicia agri]RYU92744.1 hypothetical protein EWM59_25575 [Emticicia agri]
MQLKNPIIRRALTLCLILIPLVLFGYTFQKYAINIPHWDDLAVRNSLAEFLTADSFSHKISLLFSQHNEHRIVLTRLFALLVFQLKGTLDLKLLMLLGNLSLVGILFLFYRFSRRNSLGLLALVPMTFLLFNQGLYENVFWGMASVQNFWVVLLAFVSLYFLVFSYDQPHKTYFYLAIAASFAGTFTSSNGILIPIIGTAILLFQKRYRELGIWGVASALFLFLYFFQYQSSPDKTTKADFSSPTLLLKGVLAVIGNAVDVSFVAPNKHLDLAMATGVLLLIILGWFSIQVLIRKYNINQRNNDLFLLGCLVFLGITCVGIAVGRLSYGIEVLLTSKYKINSVLILCISYLIILNSLAEHRKPRVITIAIALSICYNFYTYLAEFQHISYLRRERITDQFKIQHSDKEMPVSGIYARLQQPAATFYDALMPALQSVKDTVQTKIGIVENETGFILTDTRNDTLDISSADAGQYIVLKSDHNLYLFPCRTITASAFQLKDYINIGFLFRNQLNVGSFVSDFTKFYVQSGKYQIGTIDVENKKSMLTWTNQSINIQAVQKQKPVQNW